MFTGIIQATGTIADIEPMEADSRFILNTGQLDLSDMRIGDSIAVNGACLTVIEKTVDSFAADLSATTLALTCFSWLQKGDNVNLEKAMKLSDRINGHIISGHIDCIGTITEMTGVGRSLRFWIEVPSALVGYIARRGSIAIDGVSLTVGEVAGNNFSVNIIPHTLTETIFSHYQSGTRVNIEVDLIARYLERLFNHKD